MLNTYAKLSDCCAKGQGGRNSCKNLNLECMMKPAYICVLSFGIISVSMNTGKIHYTICSAAEETIIIKQLGITVKNLSSNNSHLFHGRLKETVRQELCHKSLCYYECFGTCWCWLRTLRLWNYILKSSLTAIYQSDDSCILQKYLLFFSIYFETLTLSLWNIWIVYIQAFKKTYYILSQLQYMT